jgi:hypothetical protein
MILKTELKWKKEKLSKYCWKLIAFNEYTIARIVKRGNNVFNCSYEDYPSHCDFTKTTIDSAKKTLEKKITDSYGI